MALVALNLPLADFDRDPIHNGRFWLQAMATVPMIDVRVYAKWLKD
jgi:hypothetical protein